MIKKTIIRVIVIVLVFFGSFACFSRLMNSDNIDKTMKLADCTLPVISAYCGDEQINYMSGYTKQMQGQYMRDTITPLDSENKLDIQINTFGETIQSVGFEVRSLDTQRLIEDSVVDDFEATNEDKRVRLNIQDLLSDNTEYLLIVKLSTQKHENVYYYTRIVKSSEYYPEEKMKFALNFNEKTFEKSEDIVSNLESNSSGDNSNFNFVNINSSFSQVTYGDLNIQKTGTMQVQLQELNSQTAVIVLKYTAQAQNDAGENEEYNMREFYRVRYTKDRMYLLEFERTMDEIFDENNKVYYSKALSLGIANSDVEYMSNSEGSIVSFVQQGNIYSYDSSSNTISKIYGFSGGDDIRYNNQDHDVKIISVDESGSTDFIVTGYMARGTHEGQTGVAIFHYDSVINGVEEKLFIESDKSYQVLRSEIGDLAYISTKGVLYIGFSEDVYEISLESEQYDILVDGSENGEFVVSKDNVYMAWQQESSDFEATNLNVLDFDNGTVNTITTDENERIKPIGFMGHDIVYGVARVSDIQAGGNSVFPMYKVIIQNEKNEIIKEYQPSGVFITSGKIVDNMIELDRMSFDGNSYQTADSDQIVHSIKEEDSKVTLASITTDKKKKEFQLQFGRELKEKMPTCLYPKLVIYDKKEDMKLDIVHETPVYYVYAKGNLDNIYTNAVLAVSRASDIAGTVVTENQTCIYERTKKTDKLQLDKLPTVSVSDKMDSLTACVEAVCEYYQLSVDVSSEVAAGKPPLDVLKYALGQERVVDLTGQSLDNVLYMVSSGYPVIVKNGDNSYGVIAGYNALNTILMNPSENKTGFVGMEDSRKMFSGAGNVFIGCIR